jgi:hypothetical protein
MSTWSSSDRQWLADHFGPRANFDPTERMFYGHDIAAVPGLIKPLLGGTTPDAVVQPVSEEEVAAAAETVTVEPGITWEKLDKALEPRGLTLRLYPTSYPSSFVGGWLAEAQAVQADTVLALCPCCEFQLRVTKEKKGMPVEIHDLAAFACRALGKTFEPGMMPKVMPAMLERAGAMIPMPDYMKEQMPTLMPKVMDTLMPQMLPDVVPLVVPKMISYLRGRRVEDVRSGDLVDR